MVRRELATPLAGLKVLEFSHTVMGPTAGLIIAELGADVVKIEDAPKTVKSILPGVNSDAQCNGLSPDHLPL